MNGCDHELLVCLTEVCAEVQKPACKALRFGLDCAWTGGRSNRREITAEIGGLLAVVDRLVAARVLDDADIQQARRDKAKVLPKFLMQQRPAGGQ